MYIENIQTISRCSTMANAIGTINAVAAVLLIHIDKNNVTNISPKDNLKNTVSQQYV